VKEKAAEAAAEEASRHAAENKASELDILRQSVEEAKAKAADYYDQLLRLKAEWENYRKRVEKEKIESRRWGKEEIILRLVSLMDVMEQAEAVAHRTPDLKTMVQGLDMLYGEFKRLLREEGLEEIPAAVNGAYDHTLHEAMETVEGEGEDGKILEVYQKGYKFQGMLFRPARVKVLKKADGGKALLEKSADDAPAI